MRAVGRWALPGTALGIYLEAVSGYGLPHQLDSGIEPISTTS